MFNKNCIFVSNSFDNCFASKENSFKCIELLSFLTVLTLDTAAITCISSTINSYFMFNPVDLIFSDFYLPLHECGVKLIFSCGLLPKEDRNMFLILLDVTHW